MVGFVYVRLLFVELPVGDGKHFRQTSFEINQSSNIILTTYSVDSQWSRLDVSSFKKIRSFGKVWSIVGDYVGTKRTVIQIHFLLYICLFTFHVFNIHVSCYLKMFHFSGYIGGGFSSISCDGREVFGENDLRRSVIGTGFH